MRDNFETASGIPFSNLELLTSNAYSGTGRLFPSCTVVRESKDLFPAIYKVQVGRDGPVVAQDATLLCEINATKQARMQERRLMAGLPEEPDDSDPREKNFKCEPIMSREEHYTTYTDYRKKTEHSPHGFPFTIGVGGFIFVDNEREQDKAVAGKTNDPAQFVLKRTGQFNPGVWGNPSGLVSGSAFANMGQHIVRETGIVLLDEKTKTATVVAPQFSVSGKEYAFIANDLRSVDSVAIKMQQLPKIRAALEREGLSDYSIKVAAYTAHLLTDKLPLRDKVTLSTPSSYGQVEQTFRAFAVKDGCGSLNVNLPFRMHLPEDRKILCIDCEGLDREAALKTQDQLLGLENEARVDGRKALTRDLSDLIERPSRVSYIPKALPGTEPEGTGKVSVHPSVFLAAPTR